MEQHKFKFVVEKGYKTSYINSLLMGLFYRKNNNIETLLTNFPVAAAVILLDKDGLSLAIDFVVLFANLFFLEFKNSFILGVTATPLSSNINLPMYENYKELIVGDPINKLI